MELWGCQPGHCWRWRDGDTAGAALALSHPENPLGPARLRACGSHRWVITKLPLAIKRHSRFLAARELWWGSHRAEVTPLVLPWHLLQQQLSGSAWGVGAWY